MSSQLKKREKTDEKNKIKADLTEEKGVI